MGIFQDIVVADKKYTNEERKRLIALDKVWNSDDFTRYNNLLLLRKRLTSLYKGKELDEKTDKIDDILSKSIEEIVAQADSIAEYMDSLFMEYEIDNRDNIIERVYDPEKQEKIIIDDLNQIESPAMLHFFDPKRKMSKFDLYIKDLEEKRSKQLGKKYIFSEEEKTMELQYNAKENHFITDYALDFEGIAQVGSFDERYVTNTSNQLCTLIVTPQEILGGRGLRGNIALGFSKETINSELIATISDRNIHSNKGINYVETTNAFEDFSASYDELTSNSGNRDNNEIVLFRNSYESSLKPSYVMYIGNGSLESKDEKENIDLIKSQMQEAGLNVPLVIFDRHSAREKNKESIKRDCGIER